MDIKLATTPYIIYCWLLAYLRKSSRTFLVGNYLLTLVLETRNKPYTNTLAAIIGNEKQRQNTNEKNPSIKILRPPILSSGFCEISSEFI